MDFDFGDSNQNGDGGVVMGLNLNEAYKESAVLQNAN